MPGTDSAEVVIIGAGIVGLSVAYHLAARGLTDVIVLERESAPITGSSARSAAGVRHQFAQPVNVRLSLYSIARMKDFADTVGGESGLKQVGYLLLATDQATWRAYAENAAMQRSLGVRTDLLSPHRVAELVPGIVTRDLLGAAYCADDGHCDPHGIASGYWAAARSRGVRMRRSSPATAIHKEAGRVASVETPSGSIDCDWVVNSAGPSAGTVGAMAGLNIPVRPLRRCVYVTEPFAQLPDNMPMTIDAGSDFWVRKENQRLLFGLSNPDEPEGENLAVDWDWLETTLDTGLRRLPLLAEARLATRNCWAGLYEETPDHNPILGRHPDLPNYVDASGFSGHGVMHSPATGMLIAEEILDGRAHSISMDELRITRFTSGALRPEANAF